MAHKKTVCRLTEEIPTDRSVSDNPLFSTLGTQRTRKSYFYTFFIHKIWGYKKYSKSITVVEMGKKGEIEVSELPLTPTRIMREIRGTYNEIMNRDNYRNSNTEDYVRIVLTDEQDEPEAMAKLRNVYPNVMRVEYDNKRTRAASLLETVVSKISCNKSRTSLYLKKI